MHGDMERTILVKVHIMIKTSRRMTIMKSITRRMNILWISILILGLAFGSAALPLFVSTASAASLQPAAAPADPLVGYGAGTTGGAGGPTTTVTTLAALTTAVSGSTAKIVKISGTISGSGDVKVGSNTTIMGVGSTATLNGIGLVMTSVTNVIIRNMTIRFVTASSGNGDAIHIQKATKLWIDHNNLYSDETHGKDYYDGLLDISHAGDYITVSWNRFHDHYKASLIGHSDSNASEDTGHLRVTYHHNWFYNVNSRTPSLRFGTGHVYNNFFQNIDDSGIHSRENAQMLIQNNVFSGVDTPVTTTGDSPIDGYANISGNDFGGGTNDITRVGSFTTAPYSFTLDATSTVQSAVTAYSGVGIVS
jgi:pectate lyase